MKNQFITYGIALKLKELGFDGKCFGYFHIRTKVWYLSETGESLSICKNSLLSGAFISAPLWQQVFRWLREVHDLNISINIMVDGRYNGYNVEFRKGRKYITEYMCAHTYDRAMEVAVNIAMKLITSKHEK